MSEIWRHFKCRSQLTGGLRFPLQTAQLTNDVIYYLSSPFKKSRQSMPTLFSLLFLFRGFLDFFFFSFLLFCYCVKCFLKIKNDIINVLGTDGETDGIWLDALLCLLCLV